MIIALALAGALAPALLLVWFFRARDRNPEPARVVWATFGLGVACLVPAVLVAYPLALLIGQWSEPISGGLLDALFCAALPEEACKLLVVWGYVSRHRDFDEPMDGLVYGACASLGFAALENVMYVAGQPHLAILRALTAVPGHACMGAVMGFYVGQARMGPVERRAEAWRNAYLIPVALHTAYDFPLLALKRLGVTEDASVATAMFALLLAVAAIGVLVFEIVWVLRLAGKLRAGQLRLARLAATFAPAPVPAMAALGDAVAPAQGSPLPPPTAAPVVATQPDAVGAWVLALGGGLVATIGLFITFAGVVGYLFDDGTLGGGSELAQTGLLGVMLLAGGVVGFAFGLRRLQRR